MSYLIYGIKFFGNNSRCWFGRLYATSLKCNCWMLKSEIWVWATNECVQNFMHVATLASFGIHCKWGNFPWWASFSACFNSEFVNVPFIFGAPVYFSGKSVKKWNEMFENDVQSKCDARCPENSGIWFHTFFRRVDKTNLVVSDAVNEQTQSHTDFFTHIESNMCSDSRWFLSTPHRSVLLKLWKLFGFMNMKHECCVDHLLVWIHSMYTHSHPYLCQTIS